MQDGLELAWKKQRAARDEMANKHFFDDAKDLIRSGNYSAALPLLLELKKITPDAFPDQGTTPAIEANLGLCYEKLGEKKNAVETYQRTLELIENYGPKATPFEHLRVMAEEGLKRLGNLK